MTKKPRPRGFHNHRDGVTPPAGSPAVPPSEYTPVLESKFSQSLDRGLAILASFTPESQTLGVSQIAELLQMSRSTTHRYITTLTELGYLERSETSHKYRLSLRVTNLGMSTMSSISISEQAHPHLRRLCRETGQVASLALLEGSEVVHLDQLRGPRQPDPHSYAGSRLPAYCTALGKVLLAHLPEPEQRALIARTDLSKLAPNTITSKRVLRDQLERIREGALATEDQEFAPGVFAIAAPVRLSGGEVQVAIGLGVSAADLTIEELSDSFAAHLVSAANRVSARLGYRHPARL